MVPLGQQSYPDRRHFSVYKGGNLGALARCAQVETTLRGAPLQTKQQPTRFLKDLKERIPLLAVLKLKHEWYAPLNNRLHVPSLCKSRKKGTSPQRGLDLLRKLQRLVFYTEKHPFSRPKVYGPLLSLKKRLALRRPPCTYIWVLLA